MNQATKKRSWQYYLKWSLLLIIILTFPCSLFAQSIRVTGTITDALNSSTLPGVNILEKGTMNGTVSDLEGRYSLEVSAPSASLVFSYVGYIEEEIAIEGREVINVQMSMSLSMLSEMVVIGYGVQRKEDVTGSIAVVSADDLNRMRPSSFTNALQGRAAGVHVTSTSGRPGAGVSIKVRGIGSISESSEPLYVVDGVALSQDGINSINPADIESVQILKDASSSAIYGTRGANGVVVITTKKGKEGRPSINYSTTLARNQMPRTYDVMNADQYSQYMEGAWTAYSQRQNIADDRNLYLTTYSPEARALFNNLNTNTQWQDQLTQTSGGQNHILSVRGGSENSSFFISGNYYKEDGIMINTGMDRMSMMATSDFTVNDWIKIGQTATVSHINYTNESHKTNFGSWLNSLIASPLMPLYDETAIGGYAGPTDTLTGGNERTNPIAEQMLNEHTQTSNRILASAYADIKLFRGLKYTVRAGGEYSNDFVFQWSPVYILGNLKLRDNDVSSLSETNSSGQIWQLGNFLEYSNTFGGHNITALVGHERVSEFSRYTLAGGRNIAFDHLNVLEQAQDGERVGSSRHEDRLQSLIFRAIYDFKGKYLFKASIRRDGSSKFSPLNRIGNFPSLSMGWKLNEDLFPNLTMFNMVKVRFGWGQTGNQNLERNQFLELIDPFINSRYNFGRNQDLYLGGAPITNQASPWIQWEAAEMTDFGIDVEMFESKILFTAEYYIKNQSSMLVEKPISAVFGKRIQWGGDQIIGAWMNLSKIQNRGLEMNLTYREYESDFRYSVTANFTTLKNKVVELGVVDFVRGDFNITREGHTIGSFFGYIAEGILQEDDFLQDEEGNLITNNTGNYTLLHAKQENGTSPGDLKFKDLNNDGVINDLDRTIIGKALPDFIYGLDFQFEYKWIDLSIFLSGMQNMEVYNNLYSRIGIATDVYGKDENKLVDVLDAWTPENQSTTMTRAYVIDPNRNARPSTWFLEDASFLRLRTLQLGITLPKSAASRLGLSMLRVFVSGNNLYTLTGYRGYDPEVGSQNPLMPGVDSGHYPVPKTYMLGIQVDI